MFSTNTCGRSPLLLLSILCYICLTIGTPGYYGTQHDAQQILGGSTTSNDHGHDDNANTKSHTLPQILDALEVLEQEYFAVWQGIWPTSIDWTSAVIGTYLAATLSTLSASFASLSSRKTGENIINKYFSQLVASYFGQNAFALRQEAYDDMLWVVLGWLEGIKFINAHTSTHYTKEKAKQAWHGTQFIPAFAHRARIFWELASQGWDTKLCNGGMIWSPYLTPYKNAITNELFISASVSMYLYFPGDDNGSPFGFSMPGTHSSAIKTAMERESKPHDPKYLAAAVQAYRWLMGSNMTDAKGLFVDGYHVSGWSRQRSSNPPNTRCDERNEMVYTYNQGVLLTGQRGLYEATGSRGYLEDGHRLISDVITATGWDLQHDRVLDEDINGQDFQLGRWHGLGRSGILEEACDAGAYCSQDSQTFKGIFFQHFTTFCQQLPDRRRVPCSSETASDTAKVQEWHSDLCQRYKGWIKHNALAALTTKDSKGRFGMWWGAPQNSRNMPDVIDVVLPDDAVDYRNEGVPGGWKGQIQDRRIPRPSTSEKAADHVEIQDLNDRGRGRTVETQGGGVSLLRALWELVDKKS